jgi:colanic acid biosynthesis glycosyl transferase WcaI
MHVIFLTHYYPPELGAAPARISALAHGLADRGMQVTVHSGFPNYPSGLIAKPYRNRPWQIEHDGAVRVLRSAVYPTPNRGFVRRLANHLAFAGSALATSPLSGAGDVVVAETPPLFTAAAGLAYARLRRAQLVLNVSDLWPESALELGALNDGLPASAAHALAQRCYQSAAAITAPTQGIVESLSARPQAAGKVTLVAPAVDLERFAEIPEISLMAGAPLRVLYAGTLGIAQGTITLIDAAAIAGPSIVELTIAGDGPDADALAGEIRARAVSNVRLLGGVAPEQIPALYAQADAGVVPLRDRRIFQGALPSKLFEVLAAGRPAILAARGEAAELVRGSASGVVVEPENPQALAAAFARLQASPLQAAEMGRRGRLKAREFDRVSAVERWWDLLSGL